MKHILKIFEILAILNFLQDLLLDFSDLGIDLPEKALDRGL